MSGYVLKYNKMDINRLRYKFKGAEVVDENYSQAFQDIFVLSMLDGKRNGVYVEIGAQHGIELSNTYLLETKFDWSGFAVEIVPNLAAGYNNIRKNKCVCVDAVGFDYGGFFEASSFPKQIDYLQVDIEPARQTFNGLRKALVEGYRFSVITFETDIYRQDLAPQQEAMDLLLSQGYELVVRNVHYSGFPFEDWYIDPKVINPEIVGLFRQQNKECAECVFRII